MSYGSAIVPVTGTGRGARSGHDPRGHWVRLEQIKPSATSMRPNVEQLYRMWSAAANGSSAQLLNIMGCPVEIRGDEVHIFLGFYAWPSSPDLPFSLESTTGEIVRRMNTSTAKSFSIFVNNSDVVLLPYYMQSVSTMWETPCFSQSGEQLPAPPGVLHDTWIQLPYPVFGVVRINGIAIGESAAVHIILNKAIESIPTTLAQEASWYDAPSNQRIYTPPPVESRQSVKISNVQCTVIATWLDEYGTEQTDELVMETPQCVQDLLDLCPDMFQRILRICSTSYVLYVHWNGCTGEIIEMLPEDPLTYCSQSVEEGPSINTVTSSGWLR